jgi:preprotein translocase subunit SecG
MNIITNIILLIQIISALSMIGLILIQHGKGADMGAAFGSGSSGSLFGASGGANFLSRTTAILAAVFFTATLALAYLGGAKHQSPSGSVLEGVQVQTPSTSQVPAQDPSIPTSKSSVSGAAGAAGATGNAPSSQSIPTK